MFQGFKSVIVIMLLFVFSNTAALSWESDKPEDKGQMKRAEQLLGRLISTAKTFGWTVENDKPEWREQLLGTNFTYGTGPNISLAIYGYDPFSAFSEAQEWAAQYDQRNDSYLDCRKGRVVIVRDGVVVARDKKKKCSKRGIVIHSKEELQYVKFPPKFRQNSTYKTHAGYKSKRGWGFVSGSSYSTQIPAHIIVVDEADPANNIPANESDRAAYAYAQQEFHFKVFTGDLLVAGDYTNYQHSNPDRPYDQSPAAGLTGPVNVPVGDLSLITGDKVPAVEELRQLIQTALGGNAVRDDNAVGKKADGAFLAEKNVTIFGKGTEQMRAYSLSLQSIYDELAAATPFPGLEQTKQFYDEFLKTARALGKAAGEVQADGGEVHVSLKGLPGSEIKSKLELVKQVLFHWHGQGKEATRLATTINQKLLGAQKLFSLNVVKSVFKNYLDWSGAIPGSPEDILSLMGGVAGEIPWNLPSSLSGWFESAQNDASILKNQSSTISKLEKLREFYLLRAEKTVDEMRKLKKAEKELEKLEKMKEEFSFKLSETGNINRL